MSYVTISVQNLQFESTSGSSNLIDPKNLLIGTTKTLICLLNSLLETRPVNGVENLKIAFALLKVHYLCYKVHQIKLPIVDCNWQNSFIV